MSGAVDTSVARIPSDLAEAAPTVLVVPAEGQTSTPELFRRHAQTSGACRARAPNIAIVCTGVLNTPDQVRVTSARRDDASFQIELDIRRFDGPMAANDPWVALVRVELGQLDEGTYTLLVHETERRFTDIADPESATTQAEKEWDFAFTCA